MYAYSIPEKFLRHVWQNQRFSTGNLHTADGRRVEILFPGVPNSDGGPDFSGARIRVGSINFFGDVELHRDAHEWESHLHQSNQHYNKVILHVVLTARPLSRPSRTLSKRFVPLLVLHPYLDDALRATWMQAISDERNERNRTIACYELNDAVPAELIRRWIDRLAHERMEMKIRRCEERLRELMDERKLVVCEPYPRYYGSVDEIPPPAREYTRRDFASKSLWEQLLYESVMEGLGYSKNTEPFLVLSRSMQLGFLREQGHGETGRVMAMLFGAAGLIPSERLIRDRESRLYARSLRRTWRAVRPLFKGRLLHGGDWQFFRLRPGNFPTARLASMSFLLPTLFGEDGFRDIIRLFKDDALPVKQRIRALNRMFGFEPDNFWRRHYRMGQAPASRGVSLGSARINDLIINGCLPVVLLYARVFKDPVIRGNAQGMLVSLPLLQENSVTSSLQRQLLKKKLRLTSALEQQGGIHLFKFFCASARCSACDVGEHLGLKGAG